MFLRRLRDATENTSFLRYAQDVLKTSYLYPWSRSTFVIYESNKENITFLDLNVSLSGIKLTTDLHTKSTDKHQYLHYASAQPAHTKRSIIYSQAFRMSRICSYKTDFEKHLVDMKSWFQARGYPNDLVQNEMNKVKFSGNWDKNKTKKKSKGVPLVITFHLLLKDVGNIIHKNLYLLYMDQET